MFDAETATPTRWLLWDRPPDSSRSAFASPWPPGAFCPRGCPRLLYALDEYMSETLRSLRPLVTGARAKWKFSSVLGRGRGEAAWSSGFWLLLVGRGLASGRPVGQAATISMRVPPTCSRDSITVNSAPRTALSTSWSSLQPPLTRAHAGAIRSWTVRRPWDGLTWRARGTESSRQGAGRDAPRASPPADVADRTQDEGRDHGVKRVVPVGQGSRIGLQQGHPSPGTDRTLSCDR